MKSRSIRWLAALLVLSACECDPVVETTPDGGTTDASTMLDSGFMVGDADPTVDGGDPDAGLIPCGTIMCGPGARCETGPAGPMCIPNTCADLTCTSTERCEAASDGSGFYCADISCTDDLECDPTEYCNGTVCTDDTCTPGARSCNGSGAIQECNANGGGVSPRFSCGSGTYFVSTCTDDGAGGASCSCADDWDCPQYTTCEAGQCIGSGAAPTCFLPPAPFDTVLPAPEPGFPWGGSAADPTAAGSPFGASSQVVMTPLVVNLDDDNGDGLVDARDFPEIVFLTFCTDPNRNGVLRAVHGGGPDRGDDFFAVAGSVRWNEGDALPGSFTCSNADLDPNAGLAAGDITGNGVPEIVAVTEGDDVAVFSATGEELLRFVSGGLSGQTVTSFNSNPSPAIANVDGQGLPEIVIGRKVFTVRLDAMGNLEHVDTFDGNLAYGRNPQGPISCVADLDGDGRQEIVSGSTAYRMLRPPAGVTERAECTGAETDTDEVAYCNGELGLLWDGRTVNGSASVREGFCAIADVLGATVGTATGPSNPLDGSPEVVVVANGRLQVYDGIAGTMRINNSIGSSRGGAPNIDDFDGDGYPEIGTAVATAYLLHDFQPATAACPAWPTVFQNGVAGLQGNPPRTTPGTACTQDSDCGDTSQFACNELLGSCVCLHNGWQRQTEDDSSAVTGSSVFDFNGDGAAEVVYNDECQFRVYEGLNGNVLFEEASESRTRTENPVVADVDNDGNAEIVFAASNESGFCSENQDSLYNTGLEVWGDASDLWVSARRIWNQHAYHVTNVFEGGGIPPRESEAWLPWNGRLYNTYRSQPRQPFGIAPDLVVDGVQVSSPDAVCGVLSTTLDIAVRVRNAGDLRVGPGIELTYYGTWTDETPERTEALTADGAGTPLSAMLTTSIEPGGEVIVTVRYDVTLSTRGIAPASIRAVVDEAMASRECREDNNDGTTVVDAGDLEADLTVELGMVAGTCPEKTFETTVTNNGSAPATGVVVRYYAGDPAAGGQALGEETLPGTIDAGARVTFTASIDPFPARSVLVYVVVDPDDAVSECNDGNNTDVADERIGCSTVF